MDLDQKDSEDRSFAQGQLLAKLGNRPCWPPSNSTKVNLRVLPHSLFPTHFRPIEP